MPKGSWHSIRQKRFQCPLIQMLHEVILDSWWQCVYICKPTVTISALSFWGCQYLCSRRLVTTQPLCNSDFHGCSSFFFRCWVDPKRTQTFGFLRENIQHQIGYEVRITRHQTFNPAQVKSSSRQSQFAEDGLLFLKVYSYTSVELKEAPQRLCYARKRSDERVKPFFYRLARRSPTLFTRCRPS